MTSSEIAEKAYLLSVFTTCVCVFRHVLHLVSIDLSRAQVSQVCEPRGNPRQRVMLLRVFSEMNFVLYPAHAAAAIDAISFMAGITPKCTSKHMLCVHKNKTPRPDFSHFSRGHTEKERRRALNLECSLMKSHAPASLFRIVSTGNKKSLEL
jgi:hypothetical protein